LKISVITVVRNGMDTVRDSIQSVLTQNYEDVEYIIIDGASTDGTVEIINEFIGKHAENNIEFLSEKDDGVYHAMNKGVERATGDVVGFLNADDVYADPFVLSRIARALNVDDICLCYGDLVYVDRSNLNLIRRSWRSCEYRNGLFKEGWVPPHPTVYVKKSILKDFGAFDLDYKLAADYELISRLLERHKIKSVHIPEVLVKMRLGGITNNSLANVVKQNIEILKACKKNNIDVSPLSFMTSKIITRLSQYAHRENAL
jgi:glycosyltransferase involved in cell wall biosynthesis